MPETQQPNHTHTLPPPSMTTACADFFTAHDNVLTFNPFVIHLIAHISKTEERLLAARADATDSLADAVEKFESLADPPDHTDRPRDLRDEAADLRAQASKLHPLWGDYFRYENTLYQMALARAVDNFVLYFRDLLGIIYLTRPETLKSQKYSESHEFILEHSTTGDLPAAIAARRLEAIEHDGMREFAAYFDSLGLRLFDPDADTALLRIVEQRNLITHNRGVINARYMKVAGDADGGIGDVLELTLGGLSESMNYLARQVADIDVRASQKFDLPTPATADEHGCVIGEGAGCHFASDA